jgi:hypothetical protein
MIELARNNAISDAILISGDEDLRVGVSIAQSYGVRVHLVGIHPSRGSQSQLLMQEADTKTEWSKSEVEWFLSKIVYVNTTINLDISKTPNSMGMENETLVASEVFSIVATDLVNSQDESELDLISKLNSLPREIDGKLLGVSRDKLGRALDSAEKRELRNLYRAAVNGKITK